MDHHPKEMTFEREKWNEVAERELSQIADVTPEDMAIFKAQVRLESWQLLAIQIDGERVGSVVWSTEREGKTFAVIVNAAFARPVRGVDVAQALLDMFHTTARHYGASAVRIWTSRRGLVRKLERAGATKRYVMELKT